MRVPDQVRLEAARLAVAHYAYNLSIITGAIKTTVYHDESMMDRDLNRAEFAIALFLEAMAQLKSLQGRP